LGVSASFGAIYPFACELFPTVIRATGLSAASIGGRVGGVVAPFVIITQSTAPWLPNSIFGSAIIIGGIFCFLLPETTGIVMPQTLDEANSFYTQKLRNLRRRSSSVGFDESIGLMVPTLKGLSKDRSRTDSQRTDNICNSCGSIVQ